MSTPTTESPLGRERTSVSPMNERDLIWLAGLCEGEATFDLHRQKYPRIRVGMTDRDIVGRVATLLGANVRLSLKPAPLKPVWHAEISGARAAVVMSDLLPHMGARRSAKIAEILGHARLGKMDRVERVSVPSLPGPAIVRPPALR